MAGPCLGDARPTNMIVANITNTQDVYHVPLVF